MERITREDITKLSYLVDRDIISSAVVDFEDLDPLINYVEHLEQQLKEAQDAILKVESANCDLNLECIKAQDKLGGEVVAEFHGEPENDGRDFLSAMKVIDDGKQWFNALKVTYKYKVLVIKQGN